MSRRKRSGAIGCLIIALIVIGVVGKWVQDNGDALPAIGIGIGIVVLILIMLSVARKRPASVCGVCGIPLRKTSYQWSVHGKDQTVCPNCNRTLEKRQSAAALRKLDDGE